MCSEAIRIEPASSVLIMQAIGGTCTVVIVVRFRVPVELGSSDLYNEV